MFDLFNSFARSKRKKDILPGKEKIIGTSAASSDSYSVLPVQSDRMIRAAEGWLDIYRGITPRDQSDCSLGIAASVSSEFARLVTTELEADFGENELSRFVGQVMDKFLSGIRPQVEYACACGGVMFKPAYDGRGGITVSCFLPGDFRATETDGSGNIISAVFYDRVSHGETVYTREEAHIKNGNGYLIRNTAWSGKVPGDPANEIPLSTVPEWAELEKETFIENLQSPLYAYFPIPLGNTLAPGSPYGVSVFSRVIPLLREADRQFGRLIWEFTGGELAVDVSEDIFMTGRDGKPRLPEGKERLFRPNVLDPSAGNTEAIKTFSPALRDESIINGLNRILMFIEDGVGLARGTFSDPLSVARTATEVRTMKQRTYVAVCDIQKSLADALAGLTAACASIAVLYGLAPAGTVEPVFRFGDSVLNDSETLRSLELEEVKAGVISAGLYREKWYGVKENE